MEEEGRLARQLKTGEKDTIISYPVFLFVCFVTNIPDGDEDGNQEMPMDADKSCKEILFSPAKGSEKRQLSKTKHLDDNCSIPAKQHRKNYASPPPPPLLAKAEWRAQISNSVRL